MTPGGGRRGQRRDERERRRGELRRGGGRVSLEYGTRSHSGGVTATGGAGSFGAGAVGSVFLKNKAEATGALIFDKAGRTGPTTPVVQDALIGRVTLASGVLMMSDSLAGLVLTTSGAPLA